MAALVACQRRAVVHSISSFRALTRGARLMSSKATSDQEYHEKGDHDNKVWPDRELLFNPYDNMRFPLPGNVAPAAPSIVSSVASSSHIWQDSEPPVDIDKLTSDTRHQNQAHVLSQFNLRHSILFARENDFAGTAAAALDVEMKVQECPTLMRKDFQRLFPGTDIMAGDLTVVSLCQHTESDMTGWSEQVETERESLIALYSEAANELCTALREFGYWADFIDPCSGKPALGPHTTDAMFETDERYRHFGFEIEDLGCCKVIKHHKWGSKSFVGCVFTNAPADSPLLVELAHFTRDTRNTP